MLWVHATLVHASLCAYQRFERTLSRADQESYYRDMALVARLFGTPVEVIPPTLAEFRDYFSAQIEGDTIAVTAPAQAIARVILRAPLPAPMRVLAPAHRLATAAQLPPRLRREYGLQWTPLRSPLLSVAGHSLRLGCWPLLQIAGRVGGPRAAAAV